MVEKKVPAASKKYVSNEILLTPRSCESSDVAEVQSEDNTIDSQAKDSKSTISVSNKKENAALEYPEVKANLQRRYEEAIRSMHIRTHLTYRDNEFKLKAIELYKKIGTTKLENDVDFEFLDPLFRRDIVQYTDSYTANNCPYVKDEEGRITKKKRPADVHSISYSGTHLILRDQHGDTRSLMKYRSVAKATVLAGKLIKGGALQQRWYKYLSKELGNRRVAYATEEELVYIAKRAGIKVPKRGSVYGYVNVCVERGIAITFRNPYDCIASTVTQLQPTLEISVANRNPEPLVDFRKGKKKMLYPEWLSDELKLAVHDKFSEKIVIAVYRGKRLVGEAFLPIRNVSETESLQFEGKITIFAPREEIKSKAQKVFDYLRPTRGKLQVRVTYTKSAAEELNGLSYRRALIEAIGSPICDLPRNLDNKKAIKKRGEAIKRHKAANIRWGKVKDNFDIPSTKEDVHVFQKSPKKAVVVPVLNLPTK